jgi:hypothetical protein
MNAVEEIDDLPEAKETKQGSYKKTLKITRTNSRSHISRKDSWKRDGRAKQ